MRKRLTAVFMLAAAVLLAGCTYSGKALKAYQNIGSMSFENERILTREERDELFDLREERERLLKNNDVSGLVRLKEEWEDFREPIQKFVDIYQEARTAFFEPDLMEKMTPEETAVYNGHTEAIEEAYLNRDEAALNEAVEKYVEYSEGLRLLLDMYGNVNASPFSDKEKNLLSKETQNKMEAASQSMEKAYKSRDAEALQKAKEEWDELVSSGKKEIDDARQQYMNKVISDLEAGSALTTLFSLGSIKTSSAIQGHKIILRYQFAYDNGKTDEENAAALDSSLNVTGGLFQRTVDSMKEVIPDGSLRVEYLNSKGTVISSKDYN